MKRLIPLAILLLCLNVYAAPPQRQADYVTQTTIKSTDVTANEDEIFGYLQTGVDTLRAGAVDNINEIDSSLRQGSDQSLLTGSAGNAGELGQWNSDQDLVTTGTTINIDNGNIGIGVDNAVEKLHVVGSGVFTGNVGIGTITASDELTVAGSVTATAYDCTSFENSGKLTADANGLIACANDASDSLWTDNGTTAYLTTLTDNVGIGSTVADAKLEIIEAGTVPFMISNGASGNGDFMIVTTDGNVGIGSTVPNSTLEVSNLENNGILEALILRNTDTSGAGRGVKLNLAVGTTETGRIEAATVGYLSLHSWAASGGTLNEVMRLEGDGNVGIGTTTPGGKLVVHGAGANVGIGTNVPGSKLEIKSSTYEDFIILDRTDIAEIDQKIYLTPAFVTSGDTQFRVHIGSSGNQFVVEESGNVGIGTTAPGGKLVVHGAGANVGIGTNVPQASLDIKSPGVGSSAFAVYATASGDKIVDIEEVATQDPRFRLFANGGGSQVVQIHSDGDSYFNAGNVGIGTTAPNIELHVEDTDGAVGLRLTGTQPFIYLEENDTDTWSLSTVAGHLELNNDSDTHTFISMRHAGNNDLLLQDTSGNVGIGDTGPDARLEISEEGTTPFMISNGDSGDGDFLIVTTSGNVGIGSTVPKSQLHVGSSGSPGTIDGGDGDLYVLDDLEVDGTLYGDGSGISGISSFSMCKLETTFDMTTASGSGSFGCGSNTPDFAYCIANQPGGHHSGTWGLLNDTDEASMYEADDAGDIYSSTTIFLRINASGSTYQSFVVDSVSAGTISYSNTKSGSPTGTANIFCFLYDDDGS